VDPQLDWAILRYFQLIREHLYGKLKRGSKKSAFETRKWSYRDVLTAMHRKQIHKLATKLSQNTPGSPNYLGSYNKARNQVEKKLTENQRRKYKLMAKEWSEKKLPPRMQQRYVHGDDSSRLERSDFFTLV
jgi:hypothetical protein